MHNICFIILHCLYWVLGLYMLLLLLLTPLNEIDLNDKYIYIYIYHSSLSVLIMTAVSPDLSRSLRLQIPCRH